MLINGFVIEEATAKNVMSYNMVKYGRPHTWGMQRLNVYKNDNAPQADIETNPNGIKYAVCTLRTDGTLATSTFFSLEKAEEYVTEILNGFIMHTNRVMAIEINFRSRYSY